MSDLSAPHHHSDHSRDNPPLPTHALSPKRLWRSFSHATNGWRRALKTEANLRFHLLTTLVVIILGVWLQISPLEWAMIALCIALVIGMELINTALEYLCDTVRDSVHLDYYATKLPRDMSAAAVLTTAILAIIVGLIIFLPKLLSIFIN